MKTLRNILFCFLLSATLFGNEGEEKRGKDEKERPCTYEIQHLDKMERIDLFLELGAARGIPAPIATEWLKSDRYRALYEGLLTAFYLVTHESDAFYHELYWRIYGSTKYGPARVGLRLTDWLRNRRFLLPFRRSREKLFADALRAREEAVDENLSKALAEIVAAIPVPAYLQSRAAWWTLARAEFEDQTKSLTNHQDEVQRFAKEHRMWNAQALTLRTLLKKEFEEFYGFFGVSDYVPYDAADLTKALEKFRDKWMKDFPILYAAFAKAMFATREALNPPAVDAFRQQLQKQFVGYLDISFAALLREYWKDIAGQKPASSTASKGPIYSTEPKGPAPRLVGESAYRRKQKAKGDQTVEEEIADADEGFEVRYTAKALKQIGEIEGDKGLAGLAKQLRKCLLLLSENPLHPGLDSHLHREIPGVFRSRVTTEGKGHRVLWHKVKGEDVIVVLQVIEHD